MKKIILLLLILVSSGFYARAQRLGYFRDAGASLTYVNYKPGGGLANSSGLSLNMKANYSLLGILIFKNSDSPFMIGDHLGAGFGMGYFKQPSDFPFNVMLNLEYGLKAAYAISDDIEVGLKWIGGTADYYTNFKDDFVMGSKKSFVPSVRVGKFMGSAGFGKGLVTDSDPGKYFMIEGRTLFADDMEDGSTYLFIKLESYSGPFEGETRKATQVSIGFGIM